MKGARIELQSCVLLGREQSSHQRRDGSGSFLQTPGASHQEGSNPVQQQKDVW